MRAVSENLRNYTRAVYTLDAVVNRMPADAWDNPSPCEGWTAREVLGHFMWGMQNLGNAALGEPAPAARAEADVATDDPATAWAATRDALFAALDREGSLHQPVDFPLGPMDIEGFMPIHTNDGLLHAWDIAHAGGIDACIPHDLAAAGTDALASYGDFVRQPGIFGPAVEVADDADAVTKYVAMAGRQP